jgi:hypothetical protein
LFAWKAENLCPDEPFGDDMTGAIDSAEYNARITLSGILVMVMACVKPASIH